MDPGDSTVTRPEMGSGAFHGILGRVVRELSDVTEADPAALLGVLAACCGSVVGSGPHATVGAVRHPPRLHVAVVGATSRARKGTAWAEARNLVGAANPGWLGQIHGGFGSAESLVDAAAESLAAEQPDHRLLVREGEFARVLRAAGRQGSNLSAVMRAAWDGDRLEARSRARTSVADGVSVSIVADITGEELKRELSSVEMANGFGNRFLWFFAERSKLLPEGGGLPEAQHRALARELGRCLTDFLRISRFSRSPEAVERWADIYRELADVEVGGIVGSLTARAEAQILRLSVLYAGLDGSRQIEVVHLDAARAVWDYSAATVAHLFGERTGDPIADRLVVILKDAGEYGMTESEQNAAFSGHVKAKDLDDARAALDARGVIQAVKQSSAGRTATRWFYVPDAERSGTSGKSGRAVVAR